MTWTSKIFNERVIKILTELEFCNFKKMSKDIFKAVLRMGKIEVPFNINIHYSKKKSISDEEVKMFFANHSLQRNDDAKTLFIGYPDFTKKAKEVAEKLSIIPLDIYDLLNSLVDTENYRNNLLNLFAQDVKNYIPHKISNKDSSLEFQNLISFIEHHPTTPVFIEGDAGLGKTTLLKAMVQELGKKAHADLKERIPFYVDLKNLPSYTSLEDFLFQEVLRKNDIRIRTNESFELLCQENRLIFFLDNFCRLGVPESEELISVGKNLKNLLLKGVQLIFVAPEGYFSVDYKGKIYPSLFMREVFEGFTNIYRMEPFTLVQIKQRITSGKIQRVISRNEILKEISKVPVFLDILANLDLEDENAFQKFSDIYKASIRQWPATYLTGMGKETLCEEISKVFFEKGEFDLKEDVPGYLESFTQNEYKDIPFSNELLKKDLEKAFFIKNIHGFKYQFVHSSFMHYFIAKRLAEEFKKGNYKNIKLLSFDTILKFAEDFLGKERIITLITDQYNKERTANERGEMFFLLYKTASYFGLLKELPLQRISTQNIDARNRILTNLQLNDADFKESDFSNTDFRFAKCLKIDFSNTVLESANASFSEFKKSLFNSANLKYMVSRNSHFSESSFIKTNLFQSSFLKTDFSKTIFDSSNLHGILAVESIFKKAHFKGVELNNGDFTKADFEEAVFEDFHCKSGLFAFSIFHKAQFKNITFPFSIFHDADFSLAQLTHVVFPVINLRGVSFHKAKLTSVSFKGCDLRKVNFADAVLNNVNFADADLRQANFDGAKMCEETKKSLTKALK